MDEKKWQPTFAQLITVLLILANTYLLLNGRQQLTSDFLQAADRAAINAAAQAARDCSQAMALTPIPTEDNHPFANATESKDH